MEERWLKVDTPAVYEIHVQGELDAAWSDRLGGLTIESEPGGFGGDQVTILRGHFTDQAALVGVVNTLYALRLPVLSVECLAIE